MVEHTYLVNIMMTTTMPATRMIMMERCSLYQSPSFITYKLDNAASQ
jgi:hypothetical protein